ncbi:MAG: hypothetical protein ABI220_05525 [Candidatus Saccharimonadales bacterium]
MVLILSILLILVILGISEWGWRKGWLRGELGRKFIHITVGTFVAFWPFFISWNQIRLLSLAFLVAVIIAHYFNIFHAIDSVQRPTYGQLFFAAVVGLLTFATHSKGIYAAALLQMSLADGFAALVGTYLGRDSKYFLLGHTKSVAGTAAFLATSLVILIGYSMFSTLGLPIIVVIWAALAATALENLLAFGLDNLLIPLFVAAVLVSF